MRELSHNELEKIIIDKGKNHDKKLCIIIDGMSGAGKTTLAQELCESINGDIIAMDDFFLRPQQRTTRRLNEIGGNVDYERFADEVLSNLIKEKAFSYQKFDCKLMQLADHVQVQGDKVIIIEGSYSMHPYFDSYYEKMQDDNVIIKVGIKIDKEAQKKRILLRNGGAMFKRFSDEWVPKENLYLQEYDIFRQCDFIISETF